MELGDRLTAGIRGGQPDWTDLYHLVQAPMLRTAQRLLGDTNPSSEAAICGVSATDIVDDVFLEVSTRGLPRTLTEPAQVIAYFRSATKNRVIDAIRRARYDQPMPRTVDELPRNAQLAVGILKLHRTTRRPTGRADEDH